MSCMHADQGTDCPRRCMHAVVCPRGSPFLQWRVVERPRPYLGSSFVLLHSSSLVVHEPPLGPPAGSLADVLAQRAPVP